MLRYSRYVIVVHLGGDIKRKSSGTSILWAFQTIVKSYPSESYDSATRLDDFLQCFVDRNGSGYRRESVDAVNFEATDDCGEELVLIHGDSFSAGML